MLCCTIEVDLQLGVCWRCRWVLPQNSSDAICHCRILDTQDELLLALPRHAGAAASCVHYLLTIHPLCDATMQDSSMLHAMTARCRAELAAGVRQRQPPGFANTPRQCEHVHDILHSYEERFV